LTLLARGRRERVYAKRKGTKKKHNRKLCVCSKCKNEPRAGGGGSKDTVEGNANVDEKGGREKAKTPGVGNSLPAG